ncbi:MAG: class I SAM-dependent methyltransferase [Chromatiaceae bacterium]|nr:class I SAM-dependent methyltransferase [Chromatiaceae bacterium]
MTSIPEADLVRRALIERAALAYRKSGRFAWHFARGKLAGDQVFNALLAHGLIPNRCRILDLGCGQGLLAAWLAAARTSYSQGEWPATWPPAPATVGYRGIELAAADLTRARAAFGESVQLELGDIREAEFGRADLVVILDVLHYLSHSDQEMILRRARDALPLAGLLLTRVGDAGAGFPFLLSKWVDYLVAFLRWGRMAPLHCRTLTDWRDLLCQCGFSIEMLPMRGTRAFANVLLIARRVQ